MSLKEKVLGKTMNRREFLMAAGGGIAAIVVGSKLGRALKKPKFAATPHRQQQRSVMVWKTKEVVSEL